MDENFLIPILSSAGWESRHRANVLRIIKVNNNWTNFQSDIIDKEIERLEKEQAIEEMKVFVKNFLSDNDKDIQKMIGRKFYGK